jgi:ABC-type multidrug transport system ATPase subunit
MEDWKIFKRRSSLFSCFFEIFFTFLILATLSVRNRDEVLLKKKGPEEAIDITGGFSELYNSQITNSSIAFVLPNNKNLEVDGDTFISYVMNDPEIKNAAGLSYKKFDNEEVLENFVYNDSDDSILCGVVFNNDYTDYSIRIKGSNIVDSKEDPIWNFAKSRRMEYIESSLWTGGDVNNDNYSNPVESDKYRYVFIYIQMAIDNAIIQTKTNNTVHGLSAKIGKFAKAEIHYDSKIDNKTEREFNGLAPYLLLLCIGQFFHISNRLMDEVEDRTKEDLISIGTNPFHLWFTWEIIYFPLSIITLFLYMLFDPSKINGTINPLIFIVFYTFYVISMYNVAVIVSLLIKKTRTVLVFICMFVASMISINNFVFKLKIDGHENIEKIISAIFSPIGVSMGSEEILHESDENRHIGFSNLFQSKFGFYFIFAFVDMVAYFLIAIVLEYLKKIDIRSIGIRKLSMEKEMNTTNANDNDIQEDPVGTECYVYVKNIYKYFKFRRNIGTDIDDNDKPLGKIFAANNNISFKVYKDEIFAILGHNGAGKSTLIQNMVGIIKPDHGETYYSGLPFSKNKKKIRSQFGICLQSDVLIKGFTVADHFKLHSGIKGVNNTDFESWIKEIDLVGKEHYEVQKMSGGQKRKLCIGLALIGNPKYVFLDEPTTGLDPLSRRKIWSLLLKIKKNRVIFITTHYMDEADIIADRKLILNKGTIRCLGSSVYLKNHFKMKYNLEVETSDVSSVDHLIQNYIPEATYYNNKTDVDKKSTTSSTHIWKLPVTASSSFSVLLGCLEKEKGNLLKNFSLNAPLLEELFVSLDRETEEKRKGNDQEKQAKAIELPKIENVQKPGDLKTALRLCRYRMRVYLRQKTYWFMGILVPVAVLYIFLPIFNRQLSDLKFYDYEKRELSSSMYKNQQWNYDIQNSNTVDKISQNIIQQELPKHMDQGASVDFLKIDQVNEKSYSITGEPYYVSSFSGNYINDTYQFTIYYNDSMIHSLPSTLNMLSNAVLASNNVNDTIHLNSYPFNYFNDYSITLMKVFATLLITFCISFPLSFYGTNVVRERVQNLLKQLQLNGIANKSYWLSVLISDHIIFIITCVIILLTFVICKFTPFFHVSMIILLFIFIYICGIACLLFQYCVSYLLNTESNAFLIFFLFNIVPPYAITIRAFLENVETDIGSPLEIQIYLGAIILALGTVFPSYSFVKVFKSMINIGIKHNAIKINISFFSLLNLNYHIITCLIASLLSIIVYSYVLANLTKKKYNPKRKVLETTDEINEKYNKELKNSDDDIQKEFHRVLNDDTENRIPIKILKLSKEYDEINFETKQEINDAIDRKNPKYGEYHLSEMGSGRIVVTPFENITLEIDKCECFGILGPNGSGKSSLLNTTSFTFPQTLGKIYYDGKDTTERVGNEITLGYCPQEDTLWNEFTLFEHIEMFLYLRGYSKKEAKKIAKEFISYCHLTEHKNKMPYELSGGTRRKLNILIALCCSSTKIIMDEPSAGMDPSTRRYIWDIIKSTIQNNKSSTIMSTHSMEEAELLCNRIAIMVKGRLKCIGTPEHLKMKFGNTYILDVHSNDVEKFHNEIVLKGQLFEKSAFTREDKSSNRVKYEVKNTNKISHIFEMMESCRKDGLVTDYSYSQTSLEQVFLNFALNATEEQIKI